jgi:hypothetical protein
MSRELMEFSNLIDEQFEPDNTITDELWLAIQSWFTQPAKGNANNQSLQQQYTDDQVVA